MKSFKDFFRNEDGAVTVDWVVLTAAIVGIAIAVLAVISGGINNASNGVKTSLDEVSAGSIADLITGGNNAPGTALDYLNNNGGDYQLAYDAIVADAPSGYGFVGVIDNATGYPIYQDTTTGETLSIGGDVVNTADYVTNPNNTYSDFSPPPPA